MGRPFWGPDRRVGWGWDGGRDVIGWAVAIWKPEVCPGPGVGLGSGRLFRSDQGSLCWELEP
jgi:hypothetical protein